MLKSLRYPFIITIAAIGFLSIPFSSEAQVYREEYGQNRIQYKYFNWQYLKSNNFEVYYYDGGEDLAKKSIAYLESEFSRVTETIGFFPYSQTRIFLYNSIAEKQQSNVGVKGDDFTIGGQTDFVKSQVEVAFSGDYTSFKEELIFNFTKMLVEEMWFGGNIAEMFQSTFSSPIPNWFIDGVSAYVAYGWTKEMDDTARDYVSQEQPAKFSKLSKETNLLLGQSIWNYIAQTYGKRDISNILNLARIVKDEESSISKTLGVPYKDFMTGWKAYYSQMNLRIMESYKRLPESQVISGSRSKTSAINHLKFNAEGSLLAYTVFDNGKYEVRVINMDSREEIVLYKGGIKLLAQEVNSNYPLLSWVDEFTLGIVAYSEGRNTVTIKRVGAKGEQVLAIPTVSQIQSFEFKQGGRLAALTGVVNGKSDAYLFLVNRGTIRRISNDSYDDRDISFLPETNVVLFSSNRPTDSVYVDGPIDLKEVSSNQFNLYTYDLDLVDSVYGKLTNSLSVESNPIAKSLNEIYYLSDQQGVNNLYLHTVNDSISKQMSNYSFGIKEFSIDQNNSRIAFISTLDSKDVIYLESLGSIQHIFTPATPRRELESIRILSEIRRKRLLDTENTDSLTKAKKIAEVPKQPKIDSLKLGAIDTENYVFKNESKVNSKDYKFETPVSDEGASRSFLSLYQNRGLKNTIEGPTPYEPRFQTNNVVTSFVIDELRSFSQLLEIQMNDYLENHRLHGGALVPYNFNSGYDVFLEYEYLKEAIDLKAKYYRKSILLRDNTTPQSQRYNLNRFELGAALPFSPYLRLEVTPFFEQSRYIDLDYLLLLNAPSGIVAEKTANYLGLNTSVVFDNSLTGGTNIHEGTRAKLTFESHSKLNKHAVGFNRIEADIRHYQRVTKGVYLAGRVFFGHYGGKAPKSYLLGGVDNWAFNKREGVEGSEPDPFLLQTLNDNSDILFNQFTNLRGYSYNTFQGSTVLTLSGELRLPVNQFLATADTKSSFIRNLQFLGFYDIGSAWYEISAFQARNDVNTEEIVVPGSPFSGVINDFSNPWLQSTGVGMRTMLFGFFSRLDLAWPIQDFKVGNPKLQISIGYDF
ncbi:hypothetical protein EV198_2450 [Roseivirga ehrenbergii]|uniref:Bacterial surface antigen (D15) domain-containing protein n=1 Tax=Roseivirga ehrenbergii (strain DSM 102268 / JCM 13514 / KCTC 12282 / NCIMB 14502 / KMM 6017) TaxID=279360 RepID=A0A150XTB2_ROSEK|nr:hypothetical protein [Roseivirga ehrenbergii]KYG81852.1 hypothetical protein MB14_00200 [Roseivirga ehrenbergii]TCL01662.1 hypothetical protein EV198_2450 [Roseivirga ehrenbergii]